MLESKKVLLTLLELGLLVDSERRGILRNACRKFRTPAAMALGLFLDAINIISEKTFLV